MLLYPYSDNRNKEAFIMEKKVMDQLSGLTTEEVRQRRAEMTGQDLIPQIIETVWGAGYRLNSSRLKMWRKNEFSQNKPVSFSMRLILKIEYVRIKQVDVWLKGHWDSRDQTGYRLL